MDFNFCRKYKGFLKFIKGKNVRLVFLNLYVLRFFLPKLDRWVRLLRSRRSFRQQDRQNWRMSYFNVICVMRQFGRSWCLNDRLNLSNHTCQSYFAQKILKTYKLRKTRRTFFPFINFKNPLNFRPKLKSIFNYQNDLVSKMLFSKMFLELNLTTKYIWGKIPSAKFH